MQSVLKQLSGTWFNSTADNILDDDYKQYMTLEDAFFKQHIYDANGNMN